MPSERSLMNGATLNGSFYVIGGRSMASPGNVGTQSVFFCACQFGLVPGPTPYMLQAESCSPPDGVPDPGETVTISFCIQNLSGMDTTNLIGTLLPMNGVTNPSGPQNYGVIPANGGTVCRSFTFTVDP